MPEAQEAAIKDDNIMVDLDTTGKSVDVELKEDKDEEKFPNGPWCKKNDWVLFARYAGSRLNIDGGELRILNDDEILGTLDDPEDILHALTV